MKFIHKNLEVLITETDFVYPGSMFIFLFTDEDDRCWKIIHDNQRIIIPLLRLIVYAEDFL